MYSIDCTVDTTPMADELKSVGRRVELTTAAVVSMQTAVIAAEKKAADDVCSNVNRGFHTLMLSQVSQKIAQLQSSVNSHLIRLNQQAKQLMAIKDRMQRDYHRTAARYTRLFGTLNKELRVRVQELDQPIFKFATVEVQTTTNRMTNLVATVPIGQTESVALAQTITASLLKKHSKEVLESSTDFVGQMEEQKALTDIILLSSVSAKDAQIAAPVLIYEGNTINSKMIDVQLPAPLMDAENQSRIRGSIYEEVQHLNWHDSEDNAEVTNEFARLVDLSPKSARVKDMTRKLMQQAGSYQTI